MERPLEFDLDRGSAERSTALLLVCALLSFGLAACSATPKPKPDRGRPTEPPIRPGDREEREQFESALQQLQQGNYEKARESFRLIRAQRSSGDPVADAAELYVARSLIGDLKWAKGAESSSEETDGGGTSGPERRALQLLSSLREDGSVDGRVRRAASLYWSYIRLRNKAPGPAYANLASYPKPALGPAVLERDRIPLWVLLIEGLYRNARWVETLDGSAALYAELHRRLEDESEAGPSSDRSRTETSERVNQSNRTERKGASSPEEAPGRESGDSPDGLAQSSERSSTDDGFARAFAYARSRGFDAARAISPKERRERLDSDSGFLRATAGWAHLNELLEAESLDGEQREEIDRRFREVATDLTAIGAPNRVSELSVKRATLGSDDRLVIGALLPLTGSDRGIGRRAMAGMLLAMEAFDHSGTPRVTLVFEDSTGDPKAAMERLVTGGATAVVGPLDSGRADGFARAAARHEVPLLTLTAVYPRAARSEENSFVLRNFMDPVTEARAAATVAFHHLEDRRAAVVYPDVGYGRRVSEAFSEEFRRLGGQVVAAISFDRSSSNFSDVAGRVAASDPEAIFIPDSASNVAEMAAFLADHDIWGMAKGESRSAGGRRNVHYLGTSLWYDSILTRQASEYVRGAIIPAWYAEPFEDDPTRDFGRRFRAVHGRSPGNIEAFAFDNIRWVRSLMLERGLRSPSALLDGLQGGAGFEGATGSVGFDERGRLRRKIRFLQVIEEAFQPLSLQVDIATRAPSEAGADESKEAPRRPPGQE